MHAVVLMKMVPDIVEELEVDSSGTRLDPNTIRPVLNESDDHSLEQALIVRERHGGKVTAVAMDGPGADEALYHALARGADRAVTIHGDFDELTTLQAAKVYARAIPVIGNADLILTGVQAFDDLDGLLAPALAAELGLPYLGIVSALSMDGEKTAAAVKEYPGGVRADFEADLPTVMGISSAERPPRYVPVAKVRAAMKSRKIERVECPSFELPPSALKVLVMRKPEAGGRAEMIDGPAAEVAEKLCGILADKALL